MGKFQIYISCILEMSIIVMMEVSKKKKYIQRFTICCKIIYYWVSLIELILYIRVITKLPNKGNNKITEHRAIFQRESQNS